MAKLGEVFTIASGGTPDKKKPFYYENGTIPWVKTGDLKTQYVPTGIDCITEEGLNNSPAKLFPPNTVLVAMYGATIGACSILSYEAATNQACAAFLPNENVLPTYLYYFLLSKRDQFVKDGVGGAQPNISAGYLKKVQFDLVPVRQQEVIVERLDEIENLIALRKEQLAKLDRLVKSRFVELFGDFDLSHQKTNWKSISEIGTVVGGSTPKTSVEEYWNGEFRWISPAELKQDTGVIYDSVKKITQAGIDSCALQELPIGTVILSSRAPIGKVAIAGNTFYCNQGFKNVICKEMIRPRYLYSLLLFNTEYLNSLGRGATFKEISKSIVENIKIPVPELDRQIEFENFCKQVDKSKVVVQQSLDKLETLKKSLMQEYFG